LDAATLAGYNFSANGLFDPDAQVGGHQPGCFDIFAGIYDHYIVKGSKIKATFWSEDAATTYLSIVGIKLDDDTSLSPASTWNDLIEQPSKLTHYKFMRNSPANAPGVVTVHHSFSPTKFFGFKDIKDNQAEVGALCSANPTEQAYFHLLVGHPDSATDIPAIYYHVEIEYIVQFGELKDIIGS